MPSSGELVEARGFVLLVAVAGEVGVALIVGEDDEDVGFIGGGGGEGCEDGE